MLKKNSFAPLLCLSASIIFSSMAISQQSEPIEPIPVQLDVDERKVALGRKLFFDKRLSDDNSTSCDSCHDLNQWGAENKAVSNGISQLQGTRNSPTLYNSALNFRQLWDGRANDLAHQVQGVVLSPVVMGMKSWEDAIKKLEADDFYAKESLDIYGKKLDKLVVSDAIAEFEKTLLTPNSAFDRYLKGDQTAITAEQKTGYELFKAYGCSSCHQGANVGGNMFQKFGVLDDISLQNGTLSNDLGRFNVTKNEWDKRVFKVPSLRLATKTPPYFHDGSVKTIEDAVDIMIKYQLGRGVPQEHRDAIISFLDSLVGEKVQGGQ
ncbi:MAG: cytochrome-c peroxidase [Arenicella sp.]